VVAAGHRRLLDLDLVLLDNVVHRRELEGEEVDVALVEVAHAKVRVVRGDAGLAEALMVVRRAHRLAPRDLSVPGKVLDDEPAAHDRCEADGTPEGHDGGVVPDFPHGVGAAVDAALGDLLPVRNGVLT